MPFTFIQPTAAGLLTERWCVQYTPADWGACSNTCGAGVSRRLMSCRDDASKTVLPGSSPQCSHCNEALERPCFTECNTCASNKGKGPCLYGTCQAQGKNGAASCSCNDGYRGETLAHRHMPPYNVALCVTAVQRRTSLCRSSHGPGIVQNSWRSGRVAQSVCTKCMCLAGSTLHSDPDPAARSRGHDREVHRVK